ncbi:hypothetical protein BH739_04675 [Enterococcus casseliflavus]|nr:hypothetical protein BH739_04675 [Enterococcus casseliflavus]
MAKESLRLVSYEGMVPTKEVFELYEGLAFLEAENLRLLASQRQATCEVQVFSRKEDVLFSETLILPSTQDIETIFIQQLMQQPAVRQTKKMNRPQTKDNHKQKRLSFLVVPTVVRKVVIFLLFILLGLFGYFFFDSSSKESWESLLASENYSQALKNYPEKKQEMYEELVDERKFDVLYKLTDYFSKEDIAFDQAFSEEAWEQAIAYEQGQLTEERRIQLLYAYLQLDQLEEAEILLSYIEEDVASLVAEAWQKRAINYLRQGNMKEAKKIVDRQQTKKLDELYEIALLYQEMIQFYQEKEDSDNLSIWEKRLKELE